MSTIQEFCLTMLASNRLSSPSYRLSSATSSWQGLVVESVAEGFDVAPVHPHCLRDSPLARRSDDTRDPAPSGRRRRLPARRPPLVA